MPAFSTFSYQWIRVDGGTETNIGVDSARYQRVDADTGKLIKVDGLVQRTLHGWLGDSLPACPSARSPRPAGPSQAPVDAGRQHRPDGVGHGE